MVDPITIAGPGINLFGRFLDYILHKVKEDSIKSDLAITLETPINNAEKSLELFLLALYRLTGAEILAEVMEPPNPTTTAQLIMKDFFESYQAFIRDFKGLTKYFDAHRDELRVVLDSQDMFIIEAFIKAFEGDSPDWKFLIEHGMVKSNIQETLTKQKSFRNELSRVHSEMVTQIPSLNNYMQIPQMNEAEKQKMVSEFVFKSLIDSYSKKK